MHQPYGHMHKRWMYGWKAYMEGSSQSDTYLVATARVSCRLTEVVLHSTKLRF